MRIFIGSASEQRPFVDYVTNFLREHYADKLEPVPWTVYWKGGYFTLENLQTLADETDASILFWTPDDKTWYRGRQRDEPRDNLVFEAGLFHAAHGRHRTQIVLPEYDDEKKNKKVAAIPTDLHGLTLNYFKWAEGDLNATGLPQALRNILANLASLGPRVRPPGDLLFLKDRPGISEIRTFVGGVHELVSAHFPLFVNQPAVRSVDILVAYRLGFEKRRILDPLRTRPDVNLRVCFANMWDECLVSCYLRKYHDREGPHMRDAIEEAIKGLLGSCKIAACDKGILVTGVRKSAASYDIRLTGQRITFSYYRIDDLAFVVPLDMKTDADPAPQAWLLSKAIAPATFDSYLTEFESMFSEASNVFKRRGRK